MKKTRGAPATSSKDSTHFPVVCLGASAGGLDAFIKVLEKIPADSGMALVLVQHLDPNHQSMSAQIISRSTKLKVEEVSDGTGLKRDHVYMIPPNFNLEISEGVLNLRRRNGGPAANMAIDIFMQSLAKEEKNRAIGVLLSGTGTDGTIGLAAIKAEGGVTIVQSPKSAKFSGMPQSAITASVADYILNPDHIAAELLKLAKHPYVLNDTASSPRDDQPNPVVGSALQQIFSYLQNHKKVDFSGYKHATLKRRIQRRMVVNKSRDLQDYADFLNGNETEINALFDDILIHVTEFFRDAESFEALKKVVLPELIIDRPSSSPVRVWVPGCASGEEVYSLAICLLEVMAKSGKQLQIQIFATDISAPAIQKARNGVYSTTSVRNISAERLQHFFDKVDNGYKIHKRVRDLCLFSRHDVTGDPPFAKLDLISCRNLLIYFGAALQKRVIPLFHYALRTGGFLWLGKSENPGEFSKLFNVVEKTHKIYSKSDLQTPMNFHFRSKDFRTSPEALKSAQTFLNPAADFQKEADRLILSRYAPPGVIVTAQFEIIQFRGRTVPYLEPSSGKPTLNLLKMARPELLPALRQAFKAAKKAKKTATQKGITFKVGRTTHYVDIDVVNINSKLPEKEQTFLVFFKETEPSASAAKKSAKKATGKRDHRDKRILELTRELSDLKDYQESIIEQYEETQEELTSTNEELQSTNEEFQSTNEEIETSQEELQSTNEELVTVNDELQIRNADLSQLSSDLNNLLAVIEIPVLIIGSNNRIRMFSPKAKTMFNLIPSDIGRPVSDIRSNIDLDVESLVSEVSETLELKEIEIQESAGSWMRVQVRPYRTVDNRLDGVVISMLDINLLKQSQIKTREMLEYHTSVAEAVPLPLAVINPGLEFESGNNSFYIYFKLTPKSTGRDILKVLKISEESRVALLSAVKGTISDNRVFSDLEIECDVPGSGTRKILCSGGRIHWSGPKPDAALISFIDVTEQRLFEEERKFLLRQEQEARLLADSANRAKDVFLATVSHELRTPLASILSWAQLIAEGKVDYEKAREGAADIERSAKIQNQLIDDLLDISRIIVGKLGLTIQTVDPLTAIQMAITSVQPMALKKSIRIIPKLSNESAMIHADPVRLQQVVWNLLTNAIKFSPNEETVEVDLDYVKINQRRFARIRVSDHGKGVAEEFLPHIFSQFSQADSASTRVHGGLGLGLSIVHKLVELHGGSITVANSEETGGAVFTALFPLVSYHNIAIVSPEPGDLTAKSGAVHTQTEPAPKLDGLKILVVDDDDSAREAIGIYLRSFGAEVLDVDSAEKALTSLESFSPDVLVSDIAMPGEDGYDLIKKVRMLDAKSGGSVPAIALTAYATAEDRERALNAGFQAHLTKPVDANNLGQLIKKISSENNR